MTLASDSYSVFHEELSSVAARFDDLVAAQGALPGLDAKTKQLVVVAIHAAMRSPTGVRWHAMMAAQEGATREEIVGAVALSLHLAGLASVLEALPEALAGLELAATTTAPA